MPGEDKLQRIRGQIDALDLQIQDLINRRALAAKEIASVKLEEDKDAFFYRPEREAAILKTIQRRNKGPMGDEEMARLFREIMSACLALEQPLKIAYLGPEGTFTQAAALKHFGHAAICVPQTTSGKPRAARSLSWSWCRHWPISSTPASLSSVRAC